MKPKSPVIIFYDGNCGLCHGFVRFVLRRDHLAKRFLFSPLYSETFTKMVSEEKRRKLPDSVVVQTEQGLLLSRSQAVFYVLSLMEGKLRVLSKFLSIFPQAFTDALYDFVARMRRQLFSRPKGVCPTIPHELRDRFLLN